MECTSCCKGLFIVFVTLSFYSPNLLLFVWDGAQIKVSRHLEMIQYEMDNIYVCSE